MNSKILALLLIFVLALSAPLAAAEKSLVDFNSQPGKYLVTIGPNGALVAVEKVTVVTVGPVNPDNPDVPVIPPVNNLSENAKAIRDAALKATTDPNKDQTAAELSVLYSEIAKKVRSGELKGQDAIAFVAKAGADAVIKTQSAAWKPMRDEFGKQWVKAVQEGATDAQLAKLLDDASAGCMASAKAQGALNLAEILKLIQTILEIVKTLRPQ